MKKDQIKWACRRGMLELDLILNNFVQEAYDDLKDHEKTTFQALLANSDPHLFGLLFGQATPLEQASAALVEKIRIHARNRIHS